MSTCIKCARKSYLNITLCEDCWRIVFDLPETFRKKKEKTLRDIIIQYVIERWGVNVMWNLSILKSKYKADLQFFTFSNSLIIIEIDEYNHKLYLNDRKRDKIIKKLHKNIFILRINVDDYYDKIYYPKIWTNNPWIDLTSHVINNDITTNYEELFRRTEIIKNCIDNYFNPLLPGKDINLFYN